MAINKDEAAVLHSTHDWESIIGQQVRQLRLGFAPPLDQKSLANAAGVSVGAVKTLETGKGSSLGTLIKVLRALKATEWLQQLAPGSGFSPLRALKNQTPTRQRVSRPRAPKV